MSPEALNLILQAIVAATSVIGAIALYNRGLNSRFEKLEDELLKMDTRLDEQKLELVDIRAYVKSNAEKLSEVAEQLKEQEKRTVDHHTRLARLEK